MPSEEHGLKGRRLTFRAGVEHYVKIEDVDGLPDLSAEGTAFEFVYLDRFSRLLPLPRAAALGHLVLRRTNRSAKEHVGQGGDLDIALDQNPKIGEVLSTQHRRGC